MKIKYVIYLIVSIIILTITISVSSSLIIAYFKANQDWVSALIGFSGNIIGGILGGYIAFFVAKFQIDESLKSQKKTELQEVANIAFILKEEIKNNSLTLDSIIVTETMEASLIKFDLSRETWILFSSRVATKLDEPLFISLNTIYRKIQVFQSMDIEDIAAEVSIENIQRLKYQFDDCIRKLNDFLEENS
ncbi:hypothetical protein QP794_01520 [Paenibacillus sp. UMB7766-LJ446]|uniref:hypothetical protein n=1 Tax=Paenibacillus sp. UMB7766-LJ446 TaxID=3046313 RepID=UPI0025503090|nr:hypothetical protein [Paenibacillus sp. UMB7766-LJ446]MDK8188760.1 hypothetical protein [Paenibacillus sp. UMB7766-LJ446]